MKTKHDGDCWIYAINGVCTCGYFHQLASKFWGGTLDEEIENSVKDDFYRHESILHKLNHLKDTDFGETKKEPNPETIALFNKLFPPSKE